MTLGAWSQVDNDHEGNVVRNSGGRPEKQAQRMKATGRRTDGDYAGSDDQPWRNRSVIGIIHGAPLETAGSPV
jgi:hypothetical protein